MDLLNFMIDLREIRKTPEGRRRYYFKIPRNNNRAHFKKVVIATKKDQIFDQIIVETL